LATSAILSLGLAQNGYAITSLEELQRQSAEKFQDKSSVNTSAEKFREKLNVVEGKLTKRRNSTRK
jgi:hypothetical protein